ncbi:unnamed protein product [Prunus armeniaca]
MSSTPPGAQWLGKEFRKKTQDPSASITHLHTRSIGLVINPIVARLHNNHNQYREEVTDRALIVPVRSDKPIQLSICLEIERILSASQETPSDRGIGVDPTIPPRPSELN